jgi:putative tricarboxylic transport membrane protein
VGTGIYLWESRELGVGELDNPGPGLFPILIGVAFGVTSLSVIIEGLRNPEKKQLQLPVGKERRTLLSIVGGFAAFVILLPVLGFLISAPILMVAYMRIMGQKPWWQCVLFAVITVAAVYVIFAMLIDVRLPEPFWS